MYTNQAPSTHSWKLIVAIFYRHLWKSVLFFVLVLAAGAAYIVYAPRKYESKAQYLVRLGHESVSLDPVATMGETMGLYMTSDSVVRSTREIISSDALATMVVQRVGAEKILDIDSSVPDTFLSRLKQSVRALDPITSEEMARITLQKYLDITSPTQSNVIAVSYQSSYPQLSLDIMKAVTEAFIEEHNRVNQTIGSFDFFVEQNDVLSKAFAEANAELTQKKQEFAISSIEGKRRILESRLGDTQASISTNQRALAVASSRIKELSEQLEVTPAEIVLNATSGLDQQTSAALRQQLYDLQIREKELMSRFTEGHPSIETVQKQLTEVEAIFAKLNLSETATSKGVNPIHQQLRIQYLLEQANLAAETASSEVLANQLKGLFTEQLELNVQEQEILNLQTQLELAKAKFEAHSSKLEQARLEQELESQEITSIGVIQPPSLHERPASPNKKLVALLSFVVASFGAFCLPFALEYLRDEAPSANRSERALVAPRYESFTSSVRPDPNDAEPLDVETHAALDAPPIAGRR